MVHGGRHANDAFTLAYPRLTESTGDYPERRNVSEAVHQHQGDSCRRKPERNQEWNHHDSPSKVLVNEQTRGGFRITDQALKHGKCPFIWPMGTQTDVFRPLVLAAGTHNKKGYIR